MSDLAGFSGAAACLGLLAATGVRAEPNLAINHAVARVTVIPEARNDITVAIVRTHPRFPLSVTRSGETVLVRGNIGWRSANCNGALGHRRVDVFGLGSVTDDNMPQVVIHTPLKVMLRADGAVFGVVGRGAGVTLANAGCGDWVVANQTGQLRASLAGSGDLHAGAAGPTEISLSGSSDVFMGAAHGGLRVRISGSGGVMADRVDGPLQANLTGSGDVKVRGGSVSEMRVVLAGSGGVGFGGVAQVLDASIAGSGNVSVAKVTGLVTKHVAGSGDVTVGH